MKSIFTLIFALYSFSSFSCTCGSLNKLSKKIYKDASDVFIGQLISIDNSVDKKGIESDKLTFVVERNLLNKDYRDTISVLTTTSNCGLGALIGEHWYIFAHNNYVDQCGHSHHLDKVISKEFGIEAYNWAKERYDKSQRNYEEELKLIEQFLEKKKN